MFQIKSLHKNNTTEPLQKVFNQITHQNHYQIQCDIETGTENSSQVESPSFGHSNISSKYFKSKSPIRFQSIKEDRDKDKKIYENVIIKTVNEEEEKFNKVLQMIALKQKTDPSSIKMINRRFITITVLSTFPNQEKEFTNIDLKLETLFYAFLEFQKDKIKNIVIQGNVQNKIIKPFMQMFSKMENDKNFITVHCSLSKEVSKSIPKKEVYRIFEKYMPKDTLTKELKEKENSHHTIYEEMYLKYQDTPFDEEKWGDESQINQTTNQEAKEEQILSEIKLKHELSKIIEKKAYPKEREVNTEEKNIKISQIEENSEKYLKGSNIKERFEERFKKHLKMLSEDASSLLNNRFN